MSDLSRDRNPNIRHPFQGARSVGAEHGQTVTLPKNKWVTAFDIRWDDSKARTLHIMQRFDGWAPSTQTLIRPFWRVRANLSFSSGNGGTPSVIDVGALNFASNVVFDVGSAESLSFQCNRATLNLIFDSLDPANDPESIKVAAWIGDDSISPTYPVRSIRGGGALAAAGSVLVYIPPFAKSFRLFRAPVTTAFTIEQFEGPEVGGTLIDQQLVLANQAAPEMELNAKTTYVQYTNTSGVNAVEANLQFGLNL